MDQATGQPHTVNGKEVTGSCTFTPKAEDGTVDVTFNFDASDLAGKSVVVFEQLYRDNAIVASHEDLRMKDRQCTSQKYTQLPKIPRQRTICLKQTIR